MTINYTHAYFNSRKKLETINITKNHNITLNANGGYSATLTIVRIA